LIAGAMADAVLEGRQGEMDTAEMPVEQAIAE
ncbi:MAG: 30S ribosomal protein S2, partial [Oscillospiraceae bacterium]